MGQRQALVAGGHSKQHVCFYKYTCQQKDLRTHCAQRLKTITLSPQERSWFFLPLSLHIYVSPTGHSRALCVQTLLTQATWSMTSELWEKRTGEKTVNYKNSWYSQEGREHSTKQKTSLRKIIPFLSVAVLYVIIGKWPNHIPACDADGFTRSTFVKR